MKKLWVFFGVFFLSSCMQVPKDIFTEHLNKGETLIVPVSSVEVLDLTKSNDSNHYIENRWPQTPTQMISDWAKENLKPTSPKNRLIVVIQKAFVVRENLPAAHWYAPDEVKDTLTYQVEFIIKSENKTKLSFMVGGKVFVQMPKKWSLADKENQWVQLANKMFKNLNQQVRLKIKNVV